MSLSRILTGRTELKYYEAGLDLGLSNDPQESFRLFQQRIVSEYESMVEEFELTAMDATLPIPEQQRRMRKIIRPYLQGVRRIRASAKESAWAGLAREMRPTQVDIVGRTGR